MRQCLRQFILKPLVLTKKILDFVSEVSRLNVLPQLSSFGFDLNQHLHFFEGLVNEAEHKSPNHPFLLAECKLHKFDEFGLHCSLSFCTHSATLCVVYLHLPEADQVFEGMRRSGVFFFEIVLALFVGCFGEGADEGEGRVRS